MNLSLTMRFLCNVNTARKASFLRQLCTRAPCTSAKIGNYTESYTHRRTFCISQKKLCHSNIDEKSLKTLMDQLSDKFSEARELLQDARESQGTVYFSDDLQDAQNAVAETLEEYEKLLNKLNDNQKEQLVKSIGLRMEELKAQRKAIEDTLAEHE